MSHSFHDTRWTLVLRSRGEDSEARAALSELCAVYYEPVVAFLKREGREDDSARELAHDFFSRLLEGGRLERAEQDRGRFRSYLLGALKHFWADQRDHRSALRRGGGSVILPLNVPTSSTTSAAGLEAASPDEAPDAVFDRQWALSLLASALRDLEIEMDAGGRKAVFEALKPVLTGDPGDGLETLGRAAGLSADAAKMALHRMRKRFRALVKRRIADTVDDASQAEEEFQHLLAALRR